MLIPTHEMTTADRVSCLLNSWIAVDENALPLTRESSPIRLRRSNGRRKTGRPTKYYLSGTGTINAIVIEAYSDEEAIKEANARIG